MEIVDVIKEDDKEVIVERKFVPQPQRDLLERYFAEKLHSLKMGLDEVYEPKANEEGEKLSQLQSLKAYWNICRTEIDEIVELFGGIQPATMNPNHRKIMSITKHYLEQLKSQDIIGEEDENSKSCLDFAKLSIQYLGTFHTCLTNNPAISAKNKEELFKSFMKKEITIDAPKQNRKRKQKEAGDKGQQGE